MQTATGVSGNKSVRRDIDRLTLFAFIPVGMNKKYLFLFSCIMKYSWIVSPRN